MKVLNLDRLTVSVWQCSMMRVILSHDGQRGLETDDEIRTYWYMALDRTTLSLRRALRTLLVLLLMMLLLKPAQQPVRILQRRDQIHRCSRMVVRVLRRHIRPRARVKCLEELVPLIVAFGRDGHGRPEGRVVRVDRIQCLLHLLVVDGNSRLGEHGFMRVSRRIVLRVQKVRLQTTGGSDAKVAGRAFVTIRSPSTSASIVTVIPAARATRPA